MIRKKILVNRLKQLIKSIEIHKKDDGLSKKYVCNHFIDLIDDMLMEIKSDGKLQKEFMKL